jgi:hypothetical protein
MKTLLINDYKKWLNKVDLIRDNEMIYLIKKGQGYLSLRLA